MFYFASLSISSPFSCLDKEAVWEGRQGGRGQAGQGAVVQGPQQGGLPDLHVRSVMRVEKSFLGALNKLSA